MILNLVYPEKSQIPFKIIKFPDGQQDIVITKIPQKIYKTDDSVDIVSRFNSWKDLELIAAAKALLTKMRFDVSLTIPYLLGARSDRKFVDGGNSYLVDVLAPMLNCLGFTSIVTMDVHSDVAAACIKNLEPIDNINLIRFMIDGLMKSLQTDTSIFITEDFTLVSPDAGALKKIYNVAKFSGIDDIVIASKHRDVTTGNILSTEVPLHPWHSNKQFIIVDDICDGGRTFIEIAKVIKTTFPSAKIYLVVTHGIFSAGFDELNKYFTKIYSTNSYSDVENPNVEQLNVLN